MGTERCSRGSTPSGRTRTERAFCAPSQTFRTIYGSLRKPVVSAATSLAAPWLGAKLGAIRGGPRRSCVDTGGIGSLLLSHIWTDVDARGRRLEIYGSGGWVFESPRARTAKPLRERGFRRVGSRTCWRWPCCGSHSPSESRRCGRSEVLAHGHSQESAVVDLLTLLPPMRGGFRPDVARG